MSGESVFQSRLELGIGTSQVIAGINEIETRLKALRASQTQLQEQTAGISEGATANPGLIGLSGGYAESLKAPLLAQSEAIAANIAGLETDKSALEESRKATVSRTEANLELAAQARRDAGDTSFRESQAELVLANRTRSAAVRLETSGRLLAASPTGNAQQASDAALLHAEAVASVQGKVNAARAQLAEIAAIDEETGGRRAFIEEQASAAAQQALLNAQLRAETETLKATGQAGIELADAQAQTALLLAQQKAATEAELASSEAFTKAQVGTAVALAQQKASYETSLASDEELLNAKVTAAIAYKTQAAALDAELAVNAEYIAATKAAATAQEKRAAVEPSSGGKGGGTGLFAGGIEGIAKFALGAAAFVGITAAARDVLTETTELQKQFSILQVQLQQTDNSGQFGQLKSGLFAIARDTGIATSELAQLAVQVQGTFQGQPGRDSTSFILAQVHSAAEIQKVFGLSFQEIGSSVQALAFTFNKSFQDIGDRAAGLQSRFGVTAKELINSVSQIAPVAKELGLNFNQLTAITASAERETGRTGVSVTEALGRVLPNIAQHTQDVLAAYQGNAKLAGEYDTIVQKLGSGKTGEVLLQLIRDWSKFSQVQKDALLVSLGGGRQAPQLAAVFGDPQLLKELDHPVNDAGKLATQFAHLKDTLGQTLSEVKQSLLQLGVTLAQLGIVQAFEDLATAFKLILGVAHPFASAFEAVDHALGGVIGKIAGLIIALKLLQAAATSNTATRILSRVGLGVGASAGGEAAAGAEVAGAEVAGAGFAARAGGVAAKFLPTTVLGGITLGAAVSVALVDALASGYQQGVDKEIAKSKADAAKNALTEKGLKLAQAGSAPNFTTDIHSLGEAAYNVKNAFLGQAGKQELLNDEYQKAVGTAFIEQIKAVTQLKGFKNPKELLTKLGAPKGELLSKEGFTNPTIDQADPTDDQTFKQLKSLHDDLIRKYGKSYIDGVIKAAKRATSKYAAALRSGNADDVSTAGTDLSSALKSQFEAGDISYATYIDSLKKSIKGLQDVTNSSHGGTRKQDLQLLGKLIAQRDKTISDYIKSQVDFSSSLRDLTGSNTYSEQDIQQLAATFNNPHFTDPSDRSALLAEVIKETRANLQDQVNRLVGADAKLARAVQGEPLPEPAKVELGVQYLDKAIQSIGKFATKLQLVAEDSGTSVVVLETKAVELANYLGISYSDAFKLVLKGMLNAYRKRIAALRALQVVTLELTHKKDKQLRHLIEELKANIKDVKGAIDALNEDIAQPDIPNVGIDTSGLEGQVAAEEPKKEADDLAKRIALAQAGYQEALVALDPVAAAQAAIHTADVTASFAKDEAEWWDAQAQRVRAEQQLQKAQEAIATLATELAGAYTNDPVKQATTQLQVAVGKLYSANGQAEALQAQIDIVNAQKALAQATAQIIESQINLAQAIATAAGDSILSAQDALRNLQYQLVVAAFSDAGPAAINNIQAQIVAAQASLRDATLQERESTIDFNLQTQKISSAQAVSEYQALLSQADILGLTEAQRRDLILKIQNLKHTLNQDLQFDLPSDLRLPTLYEARRLSQTGGNYQDNRVTTITLTSTDPASTQAAVNQITDALNAPTVYGSGTRIY